MTSEQLQERIEQLAGQSVPGETPRSTSRKKPRRRKKKLKARR